MLWFQYEISFAAYCFDWWEKLFVLAVLLSVLFLVSYSVYRQCAALYYRLGALHWCVAQADMCCTLAVIVEAHKYQQALRPLLQVVPGLKRLSSVRIGWCSLCSCSVYSAQCSCGDLVPLFTWRGRPPGMWWSCSSA